MISVAFMMFVIMAIAESTTDKATTPHHQPANLCFQTCIKGCMDHYGNIDEECVEQCRQSCHEPPNIVLSNSFSNKNYNNIGN